MNKNNENVKGKNSFQPILISWSYRYRGKLARTTTNKTATNVAFIEIANVFGINHKIESQPPRKNVAVTNDNENMFPYSAKKNNAKVIELYSILYPATISASASGKSNGVRLVSAKLAMKKITARGKHGTINQIDFC